jgi:hypothetical protein
MLVIAIGSHGGPAINLAPTIVCRPVVAYLNLAFADAGCIIDPIIGRPLFVFWLLNSPFTKVFWFLFSLEAP